jgi:hypothetical protein
MYTYYTASSTGAQTQTFAYHFGVKLEVYGPALETDRDCFRASLSAQLTTPFCAVYNGNYMIGYKVDNGSQIVGTSMASSTGSTDYIIGTDFEAASSSSMTPSIYGEISTSTCVGVRECIFDVTSQQ